MFVLSRTGTNLREAPDKSIKNLICILKKKQKIQTLTL